MIELQVVDAFTPVPFGGNPAAVCLLPQAASEDWMSNVAREMNLSETAFLVPAGSDRWDLRWFTPSVEVALCGHATLASAHTLWEAGATTARQVEFSTRSGILKAEKLSDGWIRLDFPATPPEACESPPGLSEALGARPVWLGKSKFDYLVLLEDEATVRTLKPDHGALAKLPVRGVMVTAPGSQGYDFVSRFFAPGAGVVEDPVTGSAHCCLTPFWSQRLQKRQMKAFQASSRGGVLRVELSGDRVFIDGQAVSISSVQFRWPPV